MKVCIAEKPSVAKEIAHIIGAKERKDGYFEGNGYAVTWTFGHFCTLYAPDDYDADWKQWNLYNLPMLPERFETRLMDNQGVKKQFKVIESLFKKATVVINCGDAGQEGELIQRWVIKEAKYTGKVMRLWISSLTPEAIKDGFKDLRDASDYDNLYYAGSSRAIGDWLLGMNATRLFTLRYAGPKQVLSIGRVQTPTLTMLVSRYKEIENFKPEPYWELQTLYREVMFSCTEGKFFKKEDGEALFKQVEGKPFEVTTVTKKNGKELPPKLFDLTSLQVYCNNKFGFSADHTLKIVQKLYEQKLVTYPRVDTTFLPNDVYPKVNGILQKLTNYSTFTQPLVGKKIRKSKKVFNDKKVTDHHAIIPTGYQQRLGQNEQQVYDIITRRFIAAFYPDCLVANTTVLGLVEKVKFKVTGKEILDEGWRVVLKATQSKKKKDEVKILPAFVQGETGPHEPSFIEKQTQPPKLYTEASLLRAMETAGKKVEDEELRELMKANGIGRPSTRAAIIETLFKRKYIQRKKKQLIPTVLGLQLAEVIQNELLKSAELTGQWEKQLKEIEEGTYNAARFIYDMKRMVSQLVAEVKAAKYVRRLSNPADAPKLGVPKPKAAAKAKALTLVEQTCPKCQKGNLLKGKTNYGCSEWKTGCDFRLPFVFMGKKISEKQLLRLLSKGATVKLKGFKEGAQKIDGVLSFNPQFELQLKAAEKDTKTATQSPDTLVCPKCQKGTVIKGQKAYGCSQWKEGCDFRFEFDEIRRQAEGKALTKALVLKILTKQ
ncbi:type IA DNA topoisomerase [Aureispira anguillae]|uniref:DNA topoisomerase n=1 Tax=Aureispira anguillae TaxID=2864201 RepID=A0A915YID8_9BACT|nr:type IA DNA topoisomerase [Aureispira anguillae]BDS13443.1 DNA topoisomerase 3 [Aureispira anguillae]